MGQKRKAEFVESSTSKKVKLTKNCHKSPILSSKSEVDLEQKLGFFDKQLVPLESDRGKNQCAVTHILPNSKKNRRKCNNSDLKSVDTALPQKSRDKLSVEKVISDNVKVKPSDGKGSLRRNKKSNPEKQSTKSGTQSPPDATFSPHFPGSRWAEVSCNWKQLVESGKIKYNGKKQKSEKALPTQNLEQTKDQNKKSMAKTSDIWFDGVDKLLLENCGEEPTSLKNAKDNPLVKKNAFEGLTKVLAMDCEMVGGGVDGKDNLLARVSIVNHFGQCLYDKYVKSTEKVTDYRTFVSGIRPHDIENGKEFKIVQKEVSDMLNGRTLVGHAVYNDLKVLFLDHPNKKIRDTSRYKPFRALFSGGIPSLKKLSEKLLGIRIQDGEHNSVQDAQATMRLYTMHRKKWERSLKTLRNKKTTGSDK